MKKIFLAGLFHETNTFVEQPTPSENFHILRDNELLTCRGDGSPLAGFLETADSFGWSILPGVDYRAIPSGQVEDSLFESYWTDLLPRLRAALTDGIDGIFLVLHGAMATPGFPDTEGELFERIRSVPGAADLPLVAVLDLHANVSQRMAHLATALIPYRENPHTDAHETAIRATHVLREALGAPSTIRTHWRHSRLLLAAPDTASKGPVFAPLAKLAREMEANPSHIEVGVAAGFAHADTPDTGLSFWIVSRQSADECAGDLDRLIATATDCTTALISETWTVSAALEEIIRERRFPALLVEPADNIGGGAPGDGTSLLRALIERPIGRCGVILSDRDAVAKLDSLTLGATTTLALGGKGSSLDPGPFDLSVRLVSRSDGEFDLEDRHSHAASMGGTHISMGACAVVCHGDITILLTTRPSPPFDLAQWRSQGIDPEDFDVITIKAAVAHRQVYDPIAASSYTVQTPGPCSSDLKSLPYRHIRRPIYPLDPISA